jgi:hypothetical protein
MMQSNLPFLMSFSNVKVKLEGLRTKNTIIALSIELKADFFRVLLGSAHVSGNYAENLIENKRETCLLTKR